MTILENMINLVEQQGYELFKTTFDDGAKTYELIKQLDESTSLLSHQLGPQAAQILANKTGIPIQDKNKIAVACNYTVNKLTGTEVIEL